MPAHTFEVEHLHFHTIGTDFRVKNARGARNPWYHTPDPRILEDQVC